MKKRILHRKYSQRYDLKMVFDTSTNGANYQLHKWLKLFFRKMKEADPSFTRKPQQGMSDQNSITKANQIRSTLKGIHTYFHQASLWPRGGPLYMNIWALMNLAYDNLMEETQWCSIQKTLDCGHLLSRQEKPRRVDGHDTLWLKSTMMPYLMEI